MQLTRLIIATAVIVSVLIVGGFAANRLPPAAPNSASSEFLDVAPKQVEHYQSIRLIRAQDGHDYLLFTQLDGATLMHAAGCEACSKK